MDPVTLAISLINAAMSIIGKAGELMQRHNSGTPVTQEEMDAAKKETADLLKQAHDLIDDVA